MLKKIVINLFFIFILSFLQIFQTQAANCKYSEGASLSSFLDSCKPSSVVWGSNMKVELGFKEKVNRFIKNISLVLGILAIGALVYAGFIMQFSRGEDEKIKKGKDIFKWTLIGFTLLISASGIVYIVINVMFGLGGS